MSSGNLILDLTKEYKISKILNDNTEVKGPWNESAEWTATVWFPAMISAGLKHFAWIFSPNIFAELSAKKAIPSSDIIRSFGAYEDAKIWLQNQA
ncbi:hypothetical protein QNI19_05085 [Cytophagaceae bacterium DM2B3-1]|uniref:STAS/SEC14 domain-containing protein n=1 Tax=Xanthocytophaga flava TaxID=3048013 RepID=A0ABT7CF10_9BACT|nr:hypothetical protein [Xanthocytophaga flavus]MDJ1472284.1 hypothetical protein [Xanthocytophaga flavus]MDJ1492295.1 hypothetical protein [Xanthocytophaga flavus]